MNEHPQSTRASDTDTDDLARIIRAAGPRPTPPQAAYDAVFAAAHVAWQTKLRSRKQSRLTYALAASVLVAVSAALLWPFGTGTDTPVATARLVMGDVAVFSVETGEWVPLTDISTRTEIMAGDRIRTAPNGRIELELMAGTSLRLAERTEVEIRSNRILELIAGTAYVDSGNEHHDLQFRTAFGTLRDIGTQFEVRVTDAALRLRVRSGRVELTPTRGASQEANAEEQLELTREGRVARTPFPAAHADWSWVEALAVVPLTRGRSHIEYLEWIAAETGRELSFETESARVFAQTDTLLGEPGGYTPEELLEIIAGSTRLTVVGSPERSIVIGLDDIR
jgi:ferric-dicitrate binding protein FerR (iron transport regulator)